MDFNAKYNRKAYLEFLSSDLLPEDFHRTDEHIEPVFTTDRLKTITQIGRCDSLELAVYEIQHESENDPRVTLSRETFKLLAELGNPRALVLFISQNSDNYRLSLVTVDLEWDKGSRVKKVYSNPRRYSFFLGPEAKVNTPYQYLVSKGRLESFDDLKNRFSIEVVNKEFYTLIAMRFTDLVGGSRKIGSRNYEKKGCIVLPIGDDEQKRKEFAVRLIGRLVFCWFLKKKYSKPDKIPLIPDTILSLQAAKDNKHYYHFMLEPLFFETLNKKNEDRHRKYQNNGWDTIPFLNGGLFTPHDDDHYTPNPAQGISPRGDVEVPYEWLVDLLEVFDTYNFTIDESTSIDVELSIDPEMLGRIFENLLAEINPETGETARKSTGSYYTPRPIVEYMVDQAIKQYLLTNTKVPEEKIDSLLDYSQGSEDSKLTETQIESVIEALDKIKVLDPACGSGAFPIGVLQKILLLLQKVDPYSKKWKTRLLAKIPNSTARRALAEKLESETWQYIHKLGVIQNSIYGVDVQPVATEISKLRIFLSLIVDETVNDDKDNRGIEPLPNLKYKFACGNSLIDKFFGRTIKINETAQTKSKVIINRLTSLKADFFSAMNEEEKVGYNLEILQSKIELAKQLLADLIDTNKFTDNLFGDGAQTKKQKKEKEKSIVKKLQSELLSKAIANARIDINNLIGKPEIELAEVEQLENRHFKESFIWKLDFAEIFTENDGFDIVIGNPPYIEHKKLKPYSKLFQERYKCYAGTADIYVYFIEKAISLLKPAGTLSFITSNKFIKTSYGENIRKLLSEKDIDKLIDFTEVHVFNALVASCILIVNNSPNSPNVTVAFVDDKIKTIPLDVFVSKYHQKIDIKYFGSQIWLLEDADKLRIKELIEANSTVLEETEGVNIFRGVTTGYNPAFIIDDQTRRKLLSADKKNKQIIKPLLQGRNIKKWTYVDSMQYLIFTRQGIEIDNYPSLKKYLKLFHKELKPRVDSEKIGRKPGRYKWYEIQDNTAYYKEFEKEKIIWGLTADKWAFTYDDKKHYLPSNGYILTSTDISIKYLLAVLNSKLMEFYFGFEGIMTAGGAYTLKHETIGRFPIKCLNKRKQEPFEKLVDLIMAKKANDEDTAAEEAKIDQMVYTLYGLTKEEIAIVEGQNE